MASTSPTSIIDYARRVELDTRTLPAEECLAVMALTRVEWLYDTGVTDGQEYRHVMECYAAARSVLEGRRTADAAIRRAAGL